MDKQLILSFNKYGDEDGVGISLNKKVQDSDIVTAKVMANFFADVMNSCGFRCSGVVLHFGEDEYASDY